MQKICLSILMAVVMSMVAGISFATVTQDEIARDVPADTLFYFAGSRDTAFAELVAPLRESALGSLLEYLATELDTESADDRGQALRFLGGAAQAYAKLGEQGKYIPGVAETAQLLVYTVGLVPVVRIELDDAAAFKRFLDQAETLGGATSTLDSFKTAIFREYSIGASAKQAPAQLLIAVRPDRAVITLDTKMFRDRVLPLALGLQAPDTTLAQGGAVAETVTDNGFDFRQLAFVNHKAIVDALTGAAGSTAAAMLDQLGLDDELALLNNPGCSADLQAAMANWPVTVLGVTGRAVDNDVGQVEERLVSRVTDDSLMALLANLRGHVPAALLNGERKPMFSIALGLNMDELALTAMKLQARFVQADFKCPPLQKAQQQLQEADPSSYLIPAAAMLKGVQGISLSVFDAEPGGESFLNGLDAMLVVSAKHPRMVFKTIKMFAPDAAKSAHLPGDGSPVDLMPAQNGVPAVQAMGVGKHLVLFTGSQAFEMAQNLKADKLQPNGILFAHFDYGRLLDLAQELMPAAGELMEEKGEEVIESARQQMQALDNFDMRIDALVDFVKQGIVVDLDGAIAVDDDADTPTSGADTQGQQLPASGMAL